MIRFRRILILLVVLICTLQTTAAYGQQNNNLVYEIFVRSFSDSDNNSVGDIKGIIQRLDSYLNDGNPGTDNDLEVGILWLMPIFPTRSYHGYDVTNYKAINPEYGTLEDFKALIREAHNRGVRVILDVPFNHTSNQHPWFIEAINNQTSPHRTYYQIEPDTGPGRNNWHSVVSQPGQRLRYFGLFGFNMPDLNFDNPRVRQELKDIARFWLDLGVDGFRLDAAKHIYGDSDTLREPDILRNNEWWQEFSHYVYSRKPNAVLVGEVLGDSEMLRRHARGLDGLVDEPFMNEVRSQVAWPQGGFVSHFKQFIEQGRELNRTSYKPPQPFPDQPFQPFTYVASHDRNPRLASDIEDMKRRGMPHEVDQAYRLAMYMLLSMAKYPIIYSGDEIMQRGWKWNGNPPDKGGDGSGIFDETLREPFPWYKSGQGPGQTRWFAPKFDLPNDGVSKEEQEQEGGMLHLVRGITNLHTRHLALANSDIGAVLTDSKDWMVFERFEGQNRYIVLINRTPNGNSYKFHENWFPQYVGAQLIFWSDGTLKKWKDTTSASTRIQSEVYVPPFGMAIIRRVQ